MWREKSGHGVKIWTWVKIPDSGKTKKKLRTVYYGKSLTRGEPCSRIAHAVDATSLYSDSPDMGRRKKSGCGVKSVMRGKKNWARGKRSGSGGK